MEGKHIRTAAYFVPAAVNAASARQVTSVSLQLGRIIQEKAGASALHLRLVPLDQAAGTIVPNNIALFASYVQKEASGAKAADSLRRDRTIGLAGGKWAGSMGVGFVAQRMHMHVGMG